MSPKQDQAGSHLSGAADHEAVQSDSTGGVGTGSSPGGTPSPADEETADLPARKPGPAVHGADEEGDELERGASATERDGGTPDDRATTDGEHGEGEPARR